VFRVITARRPSNSPHRLLKVHYPLVVHYAQFAKHALDDGAVQVEPDKVFVQIGPEPGPYRIRIEQEEGDGMLDLGPEVFQLIRRQHHLECEGRVDPLRNQFTFADFKVAHRERRSRDEDEQTSSQRQAGESVYGMEPAPVHRSP